MKETLMCIGDLFIKLGIKISNWGYMLFDYVEKLKIQGECI
jgi:hypothetical protein